MKSDKLFLICTVFISFVYVKFAYANEPSQCLLTTSSVNSLVKCLQRFIVRKNAAIESKWTPERPTTNQRSAWADVIEALLESDENCTDISIPDTLGEFYTIEKFVEKEISFCVLYEKRIVNDHFANGWGIFLVPFSSNSTKLSMVHISVAHPFTDGSVQNQAANVFRKSRSKSLLISGVDRFVSRNKSLCDKRYYLMDGAHDNNTMFHTANLAIMKWQLKQKNGCPSEKCAFIQFHGKAKTSCNDSSIFLSTGLGRSSSSLEFYKNKTLPVQRLKKNLRKTLSRKLTANTPLDDKSCKLTAGSNIFGRALNGVVVGRECKTSANATIATGYFIHVEQSTEARGKQSYNSWAKAVLMTFK